MQASDTRFAVLLFTDIVGCAALKQRYGVPAYSEALVTHNRHFERLARECHLTILQNLGDGYFAEAGGVAEAVRFALLFQDAMREGPWGEVTLTTRVGIHAGEVSAVAAAGGSGIVAPAADLAARVMSLALGGQVLLTRVPFDEARHFIREHPPVSGKAMPPLRWLAHGPYRMKGRDEPIDIFEIGAEGLAPLTAPPDAEKAKRAIRPGEEETLGWRPAVGLEIPGRPGWHLTELLGAGGFGEVWAGEHSVLRQRRAFKFCFDDERLRALKREVTLVRLLGTALGERDDIVKIHELKLDAPPFYLESDLAPHGNLLQWAEQQGGLEKIPLATRIVLVAHTATALAAAHSIGVLHKDIKPTNILIFDGPNGEPRPRLVDFGIGALADPEVLAQYSIAPAGFTRNTIQHSTGTPTYSPPEYLAGRPYTIQGDIYGLGVLLYQLITAKAYDPLASGWERDIGDPLLREDIALCVDGDPARRLPSAADLAERLLHLDQRRAEIAEQEHLARAEAARAEAETATTAARLRAARLRKLAAAFAVLALLAIVGGALAWINQRKAATALDEVEEKRAEVVQKNVEYLTMLEEAARSDRLVAEEKLGAGQEREAFAHLARACQYDPDSTLAAEKAVAALNEWKHPLPEVILRGGNLLIACFNPDGSRLVTASENKILQVWDSAKGECLATARSSDGGALTKVPPNDSPTAVRDHSVEISLDALSSALGAARNNWLAVGSAEYSQDGTRIVSAFYENEARVWEASTLKVVAVLKGHDGPIWSARFNSAGSRLVTASDDKTARIWDASTGECLGTLAGHQEGLRSAAFSPDGRHAATASQDKTARIWDAVTGDCVATLAGHQDTVASVEFSPNGDRLVTAAWDGTARVWNATTGVCVAILKGHRGYVTSAEFSPDGMQVVTASQDHTSRTWDSATGICLAVLEGHRAAVHCARFSPDGARIVTTSTDGTALLWNATTGRALAVFSGHNDYVRTADFTADGSRVVTASGDGTARLWDAAKVRSPVALVGEKLDLSMMRFSPDLSRLVTESRDHSVRLWDVATGKCLAILLEQDGPRLDVKFSPDGSRIAAAAQNTNARVWDAATGKRVTDLPADLGRARAVNFSPNGALLVTASEDAKARIWNVATGKCLVTLEGHEREIESAEFNHDATRVVTVSRDNTARVWNAVTGICITILAPQGATVGSAEFSPNGTRIVTSGGFSLASYLASSLPRPTQIWSASTGKCIDTLTGDGVVTTSASFSPNGASIVAMSSDSARVYNARTHGDETESEYGMSPEILEMKRMTDRLFDSRPNRKLKGHNMISSVTWSPDSTRIVTASSDKTARVWDAATGESIATLRGLVAAGGNAQLAADGMRIATLLEDHTLRLWTILPPTAGPPPTWFPHFLRYLAQMRINGMGELETLQPAEWTELLERMKARRRATAGQETPYVRVLRRFVPE
ncbi:MAG: protein kinase [Verrucomicrobia bacterium]|nr:protein kinase [Verrucomicrobiota bacterium]